MRLSRFSPLRLPSLAALLVSAAVQAQVQVELVLPPLHTGHPHLFAGQAGFDALRDKLPRLPPSFTPEGGSISFQLSAAPQGALDAPLSSLFGTMDITRNSILIRHYGPIGSNGKLPLQVLILGPGGTSDNPYIAGATLEVVPGIPTPIRVSWNSATRTATASAGAVSVPMSWAGNAAAAKWQASAQRLEIGGHKGDQIAFFEMKDKNNLSIVKYDKVDLDLTRAWRDFLVNARLVGAELRKPTCLPTSTVGVCNVGKANPTDIFQLSQRQALAYKLSGDQEFLDGSLTYVDKILAVDKTAGEQFSMAGRVAALGLFYDWLYDEMGNDKLAAERPTTPKEGYRTAIANAIKGTLTAVSATPASDLGPYICGQDKIGETYVANVTNSLTSLACTRLPVYEGWKFDVYPQPPSIASFYLADQQYQANRGTAVGLLAIAGEYPEVRPLLQTIYNHFDKGFFRARADVAGDGAYHMGFAYSAMNIPEVLSMWRTGLNMGENVTPFEAGWQKELIYPYIYGLRHDGSFPARGDTFDIRASDPLVGNLALMAAAQGTDGKALGFFLDNMRAMRINNENRMQEELYFPRIATAPAALQGTPLSRHFKVAGEVLMRDSWDYPNATLLEFKSSNFSNENHQHLDQNSFSLNYKAPLLLDSGAYDHYGSEHWKNYYSRTIAHNAIVVFDPSEQFLRYTVKNQNDGGQWFPNPDTLYPTLENVLPGGLNHQIGVVNYELGSAYTYTRGNASKAYSANKMDQDKGFLRSMVFLPNPPGWEKPVTLVFDVVRTKNSLPAAFLLHSANEPAAAPAASALGEGRFQLGFANGADRILTVRNGGGMATVQTLLPLNATVLKVGGTGSNCRQDAAGTLARDCRFTSREQQSDGTYLWRNYAPVSSQNTFVAGDNGTWRMEIGLPNDADGKPILAPGAAQHFLHVIGVAVNDGKPGVAVAPKVSLLKSDESSTAAVLLGGSIVIAFGKGRLEAASLDWTTSVKEPSILALGLKINQAYTLKSTQAPEGGWRFQLRETTDPAETLRSSDQGVVTLNFNL